MAALLSDLCSICHLQSPKYCCPRCSTKTCSLPCYKRHQQRAECSGNRDPTVFVKKTQLETPAAFDHDYNFLSGLERSAMLKGERVEQQIGREQQDSRLRTKRYHEFLRSVRQIGLVICKAPHGMSRQKENCSRWLPRCKDIIWTMEWLFEDGSRRITEARSNDLLSDAFQAVEKERTTTKKRKRTTGTARRPRTSSQPSADPQSSTNSTTGLVIEENGPELKEAPLISELDPTAPDHIIEQDVLNDTEVPSAFVPPMIERGEGKDGETLGELSLDSETPSVMAKDVLRLEVEESSNPTSGPAPATTVSSLVGYLTPSSEESSSGSDSDSDIELEEAKQSTTSSPKVKAPRQFLYLVKQRVSGSQRVLIPVNPKTSIRENLRKKEILEFPTIQVLSAAAKGLPAGYILEADYLVKFREEREEMERLLSSAPELTEMAQKISIPKPALVPNANDILDILRRDIK